MSEKKCRINKEILAPRVRLIDQNGAQIGIMDTDLARQRSRDVRLDLVEMSPNTNPPVCRLMDYGRYQFDARKKQRHARKKQKQIQVKEVKFRPNTDVADYDVKLRNLRKFLENGDRAKVTMRFRGREVTHPERGSLVLKRVKQDLDELAMVEQMPKLEGRQMVMMLMPRPVQRVKSETVAAEKG